MKNGLTPTVITDKNGRTTTVYRKPSTGSNTRLATPPPTPVNQVDENYQRKLQMAYRGMSESKRERDRKQQEILRGAPEKTATLQRIEEKYGDEVKHHLFKQKMGFHDITDFEEASEYVDQHYLESFYGMERLLSREPRNSHFVYGLFRRYQSTTAPIFREWIRLSESHYDALEGASFTDYGKDYSPDLISGVHSRLLERRRAGLPFSEQQERNYLMLNLAAINSKLEGGVSAEGGGLGRVMFFDNNELSQYAMDCTDDQKVQRLCEVLTAGKVTRLTEALAVVEGGTAHTLSDGAL